MLKKGLIRFPIVILLLLFFAKNLAAQDIALPRIPLDEVPADSIKVSDENRISDSIPMKSDSIPVKNDSIKSTAIDAPIKYAAKDSMIMTMKGRNRLYLFGEGSIVYKNIDLKAEYIQLDADSSIVTATFGLDSIGREFGYPVYREGEQQYEMKTARYNFKTKKMFTTDIITQQGDGYVTAGSTKKMPNDDLYMKDGKYTTCDEHDHPHFWLQLTKARVHPGKNIVTGPAYLVVEDVPLPIAIPFGFFPFSKSYSSGVIMPTYDDEMIRGFSLREGGYYFAFSDYVDLAVTGEIYTKGSWGLNARSSYRKRYKFSGSFDAGYIVTITGDKDTRGLENSDYSKAKDFKLNWNHTQDPKANPFSTVSARVNFSTSSYNRNNLTSIYSNQYSQNTKASSVSYRYKHPTLPLSINTDASVNQISRDTTLSVSLPNVNISISQFYPFKRKEQIGDQRWYEKIYMSYTGAIKNSIGSVKEYDFFQKNIIRDWSNGMNHNIPISASFNVLKFITVSPSANYSESWYTKRIDRSYDYEHSTLVPTDTVFGFYRVYNYSGSVSANTKLYGMYKPWSLFGKWTKGVQVRHVLTPSVSFNGAPDFSDPQYGMYKTIHYFDKKNNRQETEVYSPFREQLWGAPASGKSGSMNFSVDNNIEAKVPIAGTDSARKISLIDNLGLRLGYNFLADSLNWSNTSASIRLKLFGKSTLSLQGQFDTYLYDERGRHINITRMQAGKGFGRFMGTSTGYSYSLNNSSIKSIANLFRKEKDLDKVDPENDPLAEDDEQLFSDETMVNGEQKTSSLRKEKQSEGTYDSDGYLLLDVPWNLSFNYSISYSYDMQRFDVQKREYPYKMNQTLGISGSITPTKGWNFNFNTSYDFDFKKFVTMQCSLARQMHCWSMTASIIPIGPYQSYNFTIAVNSSLLQDLKYTQSSSYRDTVNWGD